MPFELGLTIGWTAATRKRHDWFVMESEDRRAEKSLSDLKGTDFQVHGGTPEGVLREIGNALVNVGSTTGIAEQKKLYKRLKRQLPVIVRSCAARSCYEANVFHKLVAAAVEYSAAQAPAAGRRRSMA